MSDHLSDGLTLSRRALFGISASVLALAGVAEVWRRHGLGANASPPDAGAAIGYADHDGWMVSVAEKQALRAQPPQPDGRR